MNLYSLKELLLLRQIGMVSWMWAQGKTVQWPLKNADFHLFWFADSM